MFLAITSGDINNDIMIVNYFNGRPFELCFFGFFEVLLVVATCQFDVRLRVRAARNLKRETVTARRRIY